MLVGIIQHTEIALTWEGKHLLLSFFGGRYLGSLSMLEYIKVASEAN